MRYFENLNPPSSFETMHNMVALFCAGILIFLLPISILHRTSQECNVTLICLRIIPENAKQKQIIHMRSKQGKERKYWKMR